MSRLRAALDNAFVYRVGFAAAWLGKRSRRDDMLRRIGVDFNTMTSEPIGLVKLDPAESSGEGGWHEGERVLLWEPGLEAEARIMYDAASGTWLAEPDCATWRDVPLDQGAVSDDVRPRHA